VGWLVARPHPHFVCSGSGNKPARSKREFNRRERLNSGDKVKIREGSSEGESEMPCSWALVSAEDDGELVEVGLRQLERRGQLQSAEQIQEAA
jgi:hypothetical protein